MPDAGADIGLAVSTVIFALRPDAAGAPSVWLPLVRRIRDPYLHRWALPGGPVARDESLEASARRNLLETTQLEPAYLEQLFAFGDVDRSPGSRLVSIIYWALVRPDEAERAGLGENVRWFPADDLPDLAFDHNLIVEYALWRLRTKMEYSRIAHAFLGAQFTLAELRGVYQAVLQKPLDPANFRRQMEASGAIVATDEVVTGGRHRPPRLYRYDSDVELVDAGPLSSRVVAATVQHPAPSRTHQASLSARAGRAPDPDIAPVPEPARTPLASTIQENRR